MKQEETNKRRYNKWVVYYSIRAACRICLHMFIFLLRNLSSSQNSRESIQVLPEFQLKLIGAFTCWDFCCNFFDNFITVLMFIQFLKSSRCHSKNAMRLHSTLFQDNYSSYPLLMWKHENIVRSHLDKNKNSCATAVLSSERIPSIHGETNSTKFWRYFIRASILKTS